MDRVGQLRQFVEKKPGDPFPRYALALELKNGGDAASAAEELRQLVARVPGYLPAYLQLGMLLHGLGRIVDARGAYRSGQDLARSQGNTHALGELTTALEQLGE